MPNPLQVTSSGATGGIDGHARFVGQSSHSGIIITADSTSTSGQTVSIQQQLI
jgi:hypothetical protein